MPLSDLRAADPSICGEPAINVSADRAAFIWKDCTGDGKLHFRAAGGGVSALTVFGGTIDSPNGFTAAAGYRLESKDKLTIASDIISFSLRLWNLDTDGIDFFAGSGACLTPDTANSFPLYIGAARVQATEADIDLATGLACAVAIDSDSDGLTDEQELLIGTDPANPDTDGGGAQDGAEVTAALNPLDGSDDIEILDSDGDGLTDAAEISLGTNPNSDDTDSGGALDGDEVAQGTNPLDPADDAEVNPVICGMPAMNPASDRAAFIWKDCDGDGELHLYAMGGGVEISAYFSGEVQSTGGFPSFTKFSLESNDVFLITGDTLTFSLGVWGRGQDGLDFEASSGACLTLAQATSLPVYMGIDRTPLETEDVDLNTGNVCASSLDTDGDGLPDVEENLLGTDPEKVDTDDGGASDGMEVAAGSDPLDGTDDATILDSDSDGLSDAEESALGTNPLQADSDGGGTDDGLEVSAGTNPLDPADDLLADPIICGQPIINAASDRAAFLWKDCDTDNALHLRVSGGGVQASTVFAGEIVSIGGFPTVEGYSMEPDDELIEDGDTVTYSLGVWGQGTDGIDFQVNAGACLTPVASSWPLYIGADRIIADTSDINLATGQACLPPVDTDGDGLLDLEEAVLGTDPNNADSDDGGANDGLEVSSGSNPLDGTDDATILDSDNDGLTDAEEAALGTNPLQADSDGGGADDQLEVAAGSNPLDSSDDLDILDSDFDGLSDAEELVLGTNPFAADSDGGGAIDSDEVSSNTDPLDPSDDALSQGLAVKFEDVTLAAGLGGYWVESWGSAWADINGDHYPDLFMSDHRTPGRFYLNSGDGTFSNQSSYVDISNAFHDTRRDTHAASWVDFDNDGDADLGIAVASIGALGSLLENADGRLTERRAAVGLNTSEGGEQRMPVFFDYNNDGRLDLKVINLSENSNRNTVYRQNANNTFTKVADSAGIRCNNSDWAQFMDVNGAGMLEILCGDRDGKFPIAAYDYTSGYGTKLNIAATTLVSDAITADFNGDLLPDILEIRGRSRTDSIYKTASDIAEFHALMKWNGSRAYTIKTTGSISFSLNASSEKNILMPGKVGNGVLDETFIGSSGYHPASATVTLDPADTANHGLKNPGQSDGLFIGYDPQAGAWLFNVSATGQYIYAYLTIASTAPISSVAGSGYENGDAPMLPKYLVNTGGNFVDSTTGSGLEEVRCVSGVAGDFDNDMDQDFYLACRTGTANIENIFFSNLGNGQFRRVDAVSGAEGITGAAVTENAGNAESVTLVDYDLDGFLDLFVTNGLNMVPELLGGDEQLFRNLGNGNSWLELDLVGVQSNRDGMGAKVLVTASGKTQYREQNGGYHRWAQNFTRIHFGLGSNTFATEVKVIWPSGITDTFTNVSANSLYRITEGVGLEVVEPQ